MLNKIIEFSIRNKLIVIILMLFWTGWGVIQISRLPIDAVPDITNNQVQVITVTPALGAPDVERLITFPIEQACSNIPGIIELRSFSRFGLSLVTIVFNDQTDVYWARQQISERLIQVQQLIPPGVGTPALAPVTTGLGEIYQYVVRAKKGYESRYDTRELRTIQDWIVRRQLLGTPGVADVSSFGGELKQYEIAIRPNELKAYNVTVADVFNAIEKSNQNTGGAYIEKGPTVLYIRSEGLVKTISDLENVVVRQTVNGIPVLVKNVAEVKIGSAIRYGAMCYNDQGEVAGAVVMMLKGENSSAVIKRVKERITQISKSLPEGVVIEPFLDRTKMVNNAIGTVERNLLEGALIVVFVLVLFLGNLRAGLVVASVIPLSMLFAVSMMNLFDVSGNLMSLGALDFGLIVDGAVIIVETVMHRLTHSKHFRQVQKLTNKEMDAEVQTAASRMMNSAVFGQIIILIVYLPILSLEGIEGKMFKPMAQTVSFAILGAFLLSLTYVPMMSALCLSKSIRQKTNTTDRLMQWLERHYQHALERVIGFPRLVLGTALLLFGLSIAVLLQLGGEFIPKLEEGDFAVDTRVLTGSNLKTTITATQDAAHLLLTRFPEVEKVVTKIGSGEIPTDPMPVEASDMMVILKEKKEWTSATSFDELAEKMGMALAELPGITTGFQFPVQMRFNELMTGARQDVVCKIFGDDLDSLAYYASTLGALILQVNGAKDLYVESITGMPQILIEFNRAAIAQYGLSVSDINNVVNTAFAGQRTGTVFEGEKRFDLVVRLSGDARKNIEDVSNLLIPVPNGTQIPLYQVATISEKEGPNQIQREEARRRIVVGFNVRGRDVQSIVKELQQKVDVSLRFSPGYYITYGGAFKNLEEAKVRLGIAVPVALLLILLMLYFAFKSLKYGLLIYSAIPLSAIGGVLSLWSRDMPFSISAGVGFIALFGVAVLNGIVLIAEFNRLRLEGWTDARRIVLQGTKIRLRPVLITAAVASLGFLPMALSQGAGAEVQRPLATVVIGGLITSTLLTLFVLPVLYLLFEKGYQVRNMNKLIITLLLAAGTGTSAIAQPYTLAQTLDSVYARNAVLQANRINTQYLQHLSRSSVDFSATGFSTQYGQVNSVYSDNWLSITQSFAMPGVYKAQRQQWSRQAAVSAAEEMVRKNELTMQVKELFYGILVIGEKLRWLQQADSVYQRFKERTQQRLHSGESTVLELTTAINQQAQLQAQVLMLQQEYRFLQQEMQQLLRQDDLFVPAAAVVQYPFRLSISNPADHPLVRWREQQVAVARQQVQLERSRLSPVVTVGYSNISIIGFQKIGSTEPFFDGSKRFSSGSLGISVPLLRKPLTNRIKAAGIGIQQQELLRNAMQQQLRQQRMQATDTYTRYQEIVAKLATLADQNTTQVITVASQQLEKGQINYLEWTLLINNLYQLRIQYLDAVRQLNNAAFRIESL